MTAEISIAAALALTGYLTLEPTRRSFPPWARVWMTIPIGAAVYLIVALVLIVTTGTLRPDLALGIACLVGASAFVATVARQGIDWRDLVWPALAIALAIITAVLARLLHLTRLTPDSLRYLLASTDLVLPEALIEMNPADLVTRQIGLPSLQAFSGLVGRRYVASVSPLFGVSGFGLFTWLAWRFTSRFERRQRVWLVVASTVFLASSNRLLYDVFYINTHIQIAVFLLICVAGLWLAVSSGWAGWAWPAGLSLSATLLLRPEAPLVAAIILIAMAASRATWWVRGVALAPTLGVMIVWYGIALREHANYGDLISLTAPVFGSLAAVFAASVIVVLGGFKRLRPLGKRLDLAALVGLAALLVIFAAQQPDVIVESLLATAQNIAYAGWWMTTWVTTLALLPVALLVHRIPDNRLWTTPILGFGLLYWLLPLLREGAYRAGAGDSGSRILAHMLPVVVAFFVLAAAGEHDFDIGPAWSGCRFPGVDRYPGASV